jgi:PAS domain S-box-containing protein
MPGSRIPPRPQTGRLFVGAACTLAAVVALCAGSVAAYISALHWADLGLGVRKGSYDWQTAMLDAETGSLRYVATGQPSDRAAYESALVQERAVAARVRHLAADSPTQTENVEAAERDARIVMDDLRVPTQMATSGQRDRALAQLASADETIHMDRFRTDQTRMRAEEERRVGERRAAAKNRGIVAVLMGALLALSSGVLLALGSRRDTMHRRILSALATADRDRLSALSALAAALSEARTRAQVADVIVDHGMRAAGADTCTLYGLADGGTVLELLGHRGVVPEVLEKIRRISHTSGNPATFEAMTRGAATWVENEAEYAKVYPALANMKVEGPRAKAFWSVPLVAEGRTLGLLGVGFYGPRTFSDDERAFVETLTRHCSQALLRAARLQREDEGRRWFTTTLRSIGDAVIATDAEGRVEFLNPVAESLTGWAEDEARGRPLDEVFSIFSEQTREAVESPVTKVLRRGTIVGLANHTFLRSRRGLEIPIDDTGAPICNESGRMLGVVLVFRDVTDKKRERIRTEFLARAGEVLGASIDYQATLATVARFAVPTLADWCSVDLLEPGSSNPRQVAVAHVDESKVRFARELGERYPPDPNAPTGVPHVIRTGTSELYTEIPRALLEGSARDAEHLRIIRDLRLESAMVVPLRVRGRPLGAITFVYADSGRRYSADDLAFAEDFARRAAMAIENALALKETEDARARERELRDEAEFANRAKDEFLATVSHELRTPLNAILGWTVTLRRRNEREDIDRALAIVERNARLQAKLVEDVLDISRTISGKLVLNLGPTSVAEAVSAAVETVAPAAEAKDIKTSVDVHDESLTITADSDRFQQIIWNLLSNAVKFTPRQGVVGVTAYRDGPDICVCVRDTGEGIRREVLPFVFEAFQQADASTTRRHGGLGLGLAIVKRLVSAHGGTVRADSEGEGKGATFTIRLPARSVVPAISRAPRGTALPRGAARIEDAPRLDGLRLLVVDDEEDALRLVTEVLREQGAEVHVAMSAREALEMFGTVQPDVVVSDIGMPDADGLSLIRKIRARSPQQGGRTPAVALTAYARAEEAQRAFAAGFQMHIAKPVEPAHLATVVANLGGRTLDS